MRGVIGAVYLGVWLGWVMGVAAQLPPEIQVDRYLLRAERLMEAKDPKGALELIGKIIALQKEHGLTLPNEFHFKHAKVAMSAASVQQSLDAVNTCLLATGREGKFYREALELLEEAEQFQSWFDAELTCTGKSRGAECWMEVTDHPGCYVWNPNLQSDETVTWTGKCAGGQAQGGGTLKWIWDGAKKSSESTGHLKDGTEHGQWVNRFMNGSVHEGPYVEGKRHGQWVERFADGVAAEGPWVEDKRHGQWILRYPNGDVWQGPFVNGKRHGDWIERSAEGTSRLGPYVEGTKQGDWVEHDEDGTSTKGPYEEGEKHGHWVSLRSDGSVYEEGPYVNGEKHGHWVIRRTDGSVDEEGPYMEGMKDGKWISRFKDGTVYSAGPYVRGEKHGHWSRYWNDGCLWSEGPYVEGKQHGHWVEWSFGGQIGECGYNEGPYVKGEQHGRWLLRSRLGKNRVRVKAVIYENDEYVRTEREWKERYRFR